MQGLEGNRFALINKTHHSLVDGVSGVDITTVLFDTSPTPTPVGAESWTPSVEPSDAQLVAAGVKGLVTLPARAAHRAIDAARHPGETASEVREAAEGLGSVAWSFANPPPTTPLNVPIGPHRRVLWIRFPLADLKEIKNKLGGTVNDVFLATVRARWRAGCAGGACARKASSFAASSPSRFARTSSEARWATGSRRCSARFPSTPPTRWSGCGSSPAR